MIKNAFFMTIVYYLYFSTLLFFPYLDSNMETFYLGWIITFMILTTTTFIIVKYEKINNNFLFALLLNFILIWLSIFTIYEFNNLSFISLILLLISNIYLFKETKKLNGKLAYLIVFNILWPICNILLFRS